ncbi:MAG: class I SAM-dependent methyltransferase [Actinobacteria bacterium]|nr:class I SAM-dependent methyltransferase [Actinomycetota bacterium]
MSSAAERWAEALGSWAIPEEILNAAPESPWGFPVECFRAVATEVLTPTHLAVAEALPEQGTLIDVGSGGGAASIPLASKLSRLVAIDQDARMLDDLRQTAATANPSLEVVTVAATWPCEMPAGSVDVAVCANVLYNVADIAPFIAALDAACTRRVVVELTAVHPVAWMNDLWMHFHGISRPERPTLADAIAVIEDSGAAPQRKDHPSTPVFAGFAERSNAVAFIRRRLCLPATEDARVADALGDRLVEDSLGWQVGPARQERVTLWWEPLRG